MGARRNPRPSNRIPQRRRRRAIQRRPPLRRGIAIRRRRRGPARRVEPPTKGRKATGRLSPPVKGARAARRQTLYQRRSEERRVGKESRSRWARYSEKKKEKAREGTGV